MKLLITGAGGFLGQYVVAAAVERGHQVSALLRPSSKNLPPIWQDHPQIDVVRGDLRSTHDLDKLLVGVDTVIHLAAAKSGDLYEQFGGTVIATENLLNAMLQKQVKRIVAISSFSVYEYLDRWSWSRLDETSPLALNPYDRDEYCQTKLTQERLILKEAAEQDWRCVILRPGVIFGRDNLWTARLGIQVNQNWWLRTGTFAPLPLTYVENCADAVILAAEYEGSERRLVLNVVDNETPSQRTYINQLRRHLEPRPVVIPVPWTVMRILARLAWLINQVFFQGTAKIPGLFVPSRLHSRCKPLRYSNASITKILGWQPRYSWQEGIRRSFSNPALTKQTSDVVPNHSESSRNL